MLYLIIFEIFVLGDFCGVKWNVKESPKFEENVIITVSLTQV